MPQRLLSRAEFARLAGVSKPAITKAVRAALKVALVGRDRIDVDHPAAVAYVAARSTRAAKADGVPTAPAKEPAPAQRAPTAPAGRAAKEASPPTAPRPEPPLAEPEEETELDQYAELLGSLVEKFGTARNFRDWLLSLKDIEIIREKRIANEEKEGGLISRELVRTHVIGAIEAANRRLLSDAPKTMARRLYAAAKSDAPVEDAEEMIREIIGSHLRPVKTTAARMLEP